MKFGNNMKKKHDLGQDVVVKALSDFWAQLECCM
jgi:hypothetical protein